MLQLNKAKVLLLMGEAFDAGYNNSKELKDDLVAEIYAKFENDKSVVVDGESRVYKVAELIGFAEGAEFLHSLLGECFIGTQSDGTKVMSFKDTTLQQAAFNQDGYPWDAAMKRTK